MIEYRSRFEFLMAQFFGENAHGIASFFNFDNEKETRKWVKKAIRKMIKDINKIDTTERHREMMLASLKELDSRVAKKGEYWLIIFELLFLCSLLIGYDYCKGVKYYTPFYHRTGAQYYGIKIVEGGDGLQGYHDKKNFIEVRKNIIKKLKKDGHNTFEISVIINTSEYMVKKLLKGL